MSATRGASFGSKLRDARERRGVSLRQIANATKISIAALEALERNDISRLPGGIFSRAFVRSYAVEVGLEPEETIREFIAQFPNDVAVRAGHPTSDRVEDHQAVESDRQTAGTFLWLAVISVPIAAALLYFASSGRGAARAAVEPEPRSAPAAPAVSEVGGAPAVSAAPTEPAPPTTMQPTPAAPPPGASAYTAAEPAQKLTVGLSVRRPCWMSATVDGQKTIERLLQPGEQQTIEVEREMVLTASDASAIALTLNGAEARSLGKPGQTVTARLTLTNFKTYLQTQ